MIKKLLLFVVIFSLLFNFVIPFTYAASSVLDQRNSSSIISIGINGGNGSEWTYGAQSFTVGAFSGVLDYVTLKLSKTGSPTGNLTVNLYSDDGTGTNPSGSSLSTSSTLDVSTLTASGVDYTIQFPNDYSMVSGTKYWLVVSTSYSFSNSNHINWYQNNTTDSYTDGNANRSSNGSSWYSDQSTNDFVFSDYITDITAGAGSLFIVDVDDTTNLYTYISEFSKLILLVSGVVLFYIGFKVSVFIYRK